MIWSAPFWKAAAERAIKTAAQTAIATIGTTALLEQVDWLIVASTVATATVLSVLTSVASAAGDGNPSAGSFEAVAEPGATAHPAGADPVVVESGDDYDPKRIEGR